MNRDEEIREAAGQVAIRDNKGQYAHGFLMQALREAFTEGAEWADGHPRWISVEDELPPYSQQVLAYSEYNPWAEMWWSERYKEYDAKFGKSGEYLILHDNNGFATLRDDDNKPIQVTHWMRIEPPAVLSSLESTEKKWEEKKGGEQ